MYQGDRTPRFSLNECISCHAVPGADGKPVTVGDPKHFCRGCHDYAAVRVDCFECHASRPASGASAMSPHGTADGGADLAALGRYLEGAGR
jgi:predicted CXXCH cytochrome family protein